MQITEDLSVFFLTYSKHKTEIKTFAVARYKNKLYRLPHIAVCHLREDPFIKSVGKLKCYSNNIDKLSALTGLSIPELLASFSRAYRVSTAPANALTPDAWNQHDLLYNKRLYTEWSCLPDLPDTVIDIEQLDQDIFKLEQEIILKNEQLEELRTLRDRFS